MVVKAGRTMKAEEFESFANDNCSRWSDKNITIVKALVVDSLPLNEVAKKHSVTTNYANALRWRFLDRLEDVELAAFTSKEAPNRAEFALSKYARAIKKLDSQGYETKQIIDYLKTQGLEPSEEEVKQLLQGN